MLLTESEVAERLHCSIAIVEELRLARRLAYFRGPPILISVDDLNAFIRRETVKARPQLAPRKRNPTEIVTAAAALAELEEDKLIRAGVLPDPKPGWRHSEKVAASIRDSRKRAIDTWIRYMARSKRRKGEQFSPVDLLADAQERIDAPLPLSARDVPPKSD